MTGFFDVSSSLSALTSVLIYKVVGGSIVALRTVLGALLGAVLHDRCLETP